MSTPQRGYGRDVREDVGSFVGTPRPLAPPPSTHAVHEAAGHVESRGSRVPAGLPVDHTRRWLTMTQESQPRGTHAVHGFTSGGLITKGPQTLIGAREEHLASLHGVATLYHPLGVRPTGARRQKGYTEATRDVRPLSRAATGLGLLQAFTLASPAAYNDLKEPTEPDDDGDDDRPASIDASAGSSSVADSGLNGGAGSTSVASVMEHDAGAVGRPYRAPAPRTPKAARSSGYTTPTAPASAVTNSAPVRETTGAVVGRVSAPHWRQYHTSRISAGYTAPVMPQPYAGGIAIAAREADSDLRLTAVACAGVPPLSTAPAGSTATSTGAIQGTGHDGPPALTHIQEQLAAWQPRYVVSVLASEADLTLLEGALALKIGVSIVMPQSVFDTRQALVASAPNVALGASIGRHYDRLLDTVRADGGAIYGSTGADAVGMRLLSEALSLARQHALVGQVPATFVRCLIVTAGAIDDGDMSPDEGYGLARLARLHDVPATFISADGGAR